MAIKWGQIARIVEKEAVRALGENRTVTFYVPDVALFDAAKPQDGPGTSPTTVTVNAVVPKREKMLPQEDTTSMFTIVISGLISTVPVPGWELTVEGDTSRYVIREISSAQPGATAVAHTIRASR